MPLKVRGKVMGDHGVKVELAACITLLERALEGVEANGWIELQVRGVRLVRKKRAPGVYAQAYGKAVPWSIELYLFFPGEELGRLATLVLYDQARFEPALERLSDKLFNLWERTIDSLKPLDPVEEKRGRKRYKGGRTYPVISDNTGYLAHRFLVANQCYTIEQAILITCCGNKPIAKIPEEHRESANRLLEQLGLVESVPLPGTKKRLYRPTDYCYDEARQWTLEENTRLQRTWDAEKQRFKVRYEQTCHKVSELEQQLALAQQEQERRKVALDQHCEQGPELYPHWLDGSSIVEEVDPDTTPLSFPL